MSDDILERLRMGSGELWDLAISHSSFGRENNERLEFIGNAVLNLCIADHLFSNISGNEGTLSKACNYLRSDKVLAEVGRKNGLDSVIRVGPSMSGKVTDRMVAGAMEAVIGAVYLKGGLETVDPFIKQLILAEDRVTNAVIWCDPITALKEMVDRGEIELKHHGFPDKVDGRLVYYHFIETLGRTAMGIGRSKKEAEVKASRVALSFLM